MGRVYLARDAEMERTVALKVLLEQLDEPDQRRRFVREAQITGQLEHPNIIPVHELGVTPEGQAYFTMKHVRGRSLADVLDAVAAGDPATCAEFGLVRILQVVQRVAEAMGFAHDSGVIHRDLKPDNIMVGAFGEVLVMDWGLALRIADCGSPGSSEASASRVPLSASLTQDGAVVGTPHYMPPEQARSDRAALCAASDVYAIGACLYEMLTLRPPVDHEDPHVVLRLVLAGRILPPRRMTGRSIPRAIEAIVMRCLAADPAKRYPDGQSLAHEIGRYLAGDPVLAYRESLPRRALRWCRKHPLRSGSGFSGSLLLLGFGLFWWIWTQNALQRDAARRLDQDRRERTLLIQRNRALEQQEALRQRVARQQAVRQAAILRRSKALTPFLKGLEISRRRVQLDRAIDLFSVAIGIDPQFSAAYLERAHVASVLGQADRAVADFRHAQQTLERPSAQTYLLLGNLYRDRLSDAKSARGWYQRAVEADARGVFGRLAASSKLVLEGKVDQALRQLDRLGADAAHLWEVHLLRGQIYGRQPEPGKPNPRYDPKRAAQVYTRLIQLRPGEHRALTQRAALYFRARTYKVALQDLDQALEIHEPSVRTHHLRGRVLNALSRPKEGSVALTRAVSLNPRAWRSYLYRGASYAALKQFPRAIADFTRAMADPELRKLALVFRGRAHSARGDWKKAEVDLDQALKYDPQDWLVRMRRAAHALSRQRYWAAERDLQLAHTRAQKLRESHALLDGLLGDFHLAVGRYPEAVAEYLKAMKSGRSDHAGLVEAQARMGQFARAVQQADKRVASNQAAKMRALRDLLREQQSAWQALRERAPDSFAVRLGEALQAAYNLAPEQALARLAPLIAGLRGQRGRIIWTHTSGDVLALQAYWRSLAQDLPGAAAAYQQAAAVTVAADVMSRYKRGRRLLMAGIYLAVIGGRDDEAARELRAAVALGVGDEAFLRSLRALNRFSATPAFRGIFR